MFGLLCLPDAPPSGLPSWVQALPLWQWYMIPNTALSSVEPSPPPYGSPSAKIAAWNGATLKRQGSVYLLGAAGGHADYAGNEVDALALNTEQPAWAELRAPTQASDLVDASQFYLDHRPADTHTYYATQFIESQNRMLVVDSPGMGAPALPMPPADFPYAGDKGYSFSFNLQADDWDPPEFIAKFPGNGDFTSCLVVKHPVTEDVYYSRNYGDGWWRYSPSTNVWTKLSGATRAPWYAGAAIDPLTDQILIVGGYSPLPPEVRDLNGNSIAATFGGLGASVLTVDGGPGVIYDDANDRFIVLVDTDPISVYRVDPTTWTVDQPAMTGAAPARRQNGIMNSVQYVPELKGFVIATQYNGGVYFVRTAQ